MAKGYPGRAVCVIEGCDRPSHARGWCRLHWDRWRKHGDPLKLVILGDRDTRFWTKVDRRGDDECWPWLAGRFTHGYGVSWFSGKARPAHCVAYELLVGPIPEGLQLDHVCHNMDKECPGGLPCLHRRCVNPAHLEPVTGPVNISRSPHTSGHRTHCPQGHPYDEENTRIQQGRRHCIQCRRERDAEYQRRWLAKSGRRYARDTDAGRAYQRKWAREHRRKATA